MITLERILRLRHVPLFADLDTRELGRIAAAAVETTCPAGITLFAAGDDGTCLFVVLEGEIRVHRDGRTLEVLGPQAYLGEMSVLDGAPRSATATAVTDSLLLRIERDAFLTMLEHHPRAALTVLQALSRRLRAKMDAGTTGGDGAREPS